MIHADALGPQPFPEAEYGVLDPYPEQPLVLVDYLDALHRVPLPPLVDLLHLPAERGHRLPLLLHDALVSDLSEPLDLAEQILVDSHVPVHVFPHDLVLQQVDLPVLECQELAEEVPQVLLVPS